MTTLRQLRAEPLTAEAFAPFGDVLDTAGRPDRMINRGLCGRYHDRARLDFGRDGRAGVSLFHARGRSLPYRLDLLERHPEGSQTFIPMQSAPWLICVAGDGADPGEVQAFLVPENTAVSFPRGLWHGVLTPLGADGLFAVIDRIGPTPNLEERDVAPAIEITGP